MAEGWQTVSTLYQKCIWIPFCKFHSITMIQKIQYWRPRSNPSELHGFSLQFSSVQFSRSVMSDSLRPHESQHTRPPCPSPSPGATICLQSCLCHFSNLVHLYQGITEHSGWWIPFSRSSQFSQFSGDTKCHWTADSPLFVSLTCKLSKSHRSWTEYKFNNW